MKLLVIFVFVFIFNQHSYAFKYNDFDKNKITNIVNAYISGFSSFYNTNDVKFADLYGGISLLFTSSVSPLHFNEFNPGNTKSLSAYLFDVKKFKNKISDVSYSNIKIYPCPYYDKTNSELFGIAIFTKTFNYQDKKKDFNFLIQVDLNNYLIYAVYQLETHYDYIPSCKKTQNLKKKKVEQKENKIEKKQEAEKKHGFVKDKLKAEIQKIINPKIDINSRIQLGNQLWSKYFSKDAFVAKYLFEDDKNPEIWDIGNAKAYIVSRLAIFNSIKDVRILKIEYSTSNKIIALHIIEIK